MARRQNKLVSNFEALETRTMMSSAPVPHVEAAAKKAPAVVATVKVKTIVKLIDPATTEKDITYKSFANDPLFSTSGPTMSDINQGYLGDCYLLSTLATVAKSDPALIRKDIVADGNDMFTVTFGSSKGTQINVNADLPVWGDGSVAYAGLGQQGSLWVALMEKAYVIYTGPKSDNYNSIQGGWMSSAFSALGLSSKTTTNSGNASSLMSTLQGDVKAGDFTTFGTQSSLPDNSPLVAGHAYQVISVNTDASGHPATVTLRNPWGDAVADDGIVTITAAQAFAAFAGVVIAHA